MHQTSMVLVLAFASLMAEHPAHAGGLDAPLFFTARHASMGGTAIAYVNDPSAVFYNPAGLGGVHGFELIGDFSLFISDRQASPDHDFQNADSGNALVPAFFAGAALRAHRYLALGLAVYPSGAGGGQYRYVNQAGVDTLDQSRLLAIEISPAAALRIPDANLGLGVGYRINYVTFSRQKGRYDDPGVVDVDLSTVDFSGFRFGLQWQPSSHWSFGAVYRPMVEIDASAASGRALLMQVQDARTSIRIPTKYGIGARSDYGSIGVALDVEYALSSENGRSSLQGDLPSQGSQISVPLVYNWQDAVTAHIGGELRLQSGLMARLGYVFDGQVTNESYPSAFGSPPAPSHTLTAGGGFDGGGWQINLAVAHNFSSAFVPMGQIASSTDCPLCSKAGNYSSRISGVWIDFSFRIQR